MNEYLNSQQSMQPFGQGALQSRLHEPAPLLHGLAHEKNSSKEKNDIAQHAMEDTRRSMQAGYGTSIPNKDRIIQNTADTETNAPMQSEERKKNLN